MQNENSHRKDLLEKAINITTKDRNVSYGPPHADFQRIADLWNVLFEEKLTELGRFQPSDVARALICLKLSRLCWSPHNQDNWLDIAGYAACGWEAHLLADQKVLVEER